MSKKISLSLIFICLFISSQCIIPDLLHAKADLAADFLNLFSTRWGVKPTTLNNNVWRD